MRTGYAQLPLHGGKAPPWLFQRMKRLAREVVCHLRAEHAPEEILRRLADPFWFQALLARRGIGAKGLRALALVAELIYGSPASTRDPARFAFAHGGKDGTPYRVDRQTYDATIETLREAFRHARLERSDRIRALKRLAAFDGRETPER